MSECFVYIIATLKDGEQVAPVKVGISKAVGARLATIQTSSPNPLELHLAFPVPNRETAEAIERAFHTVLRKDRLHGEWFNIRPGAARFYMLLNVGNFLSAVIGLDNAEIAETLRDMGLASPEGGSTP